MNIYCFLYCIYVVERDGIANIRKIYDIMYFFKHLQLFLYLLTLIRISWLQE